LPDEDAIDRKYPFVVNFTGDDRKPGLIVLTLFGNGKYGNCGGRVVLE
jgi:hypothetical protein